MTIPHSEMGDPIAKDIQTLTNRRNNLMGITFFHNLKYELDIRLYRETTGRIYNLMCATVQSNLIKELFVDARKEEPNHDNLA
jgi:hypothetical protein